MNRLPLFFRVLAEVKADDYYKLCAKDEAHGRKSQPPSEIFQRADRVTLKEEKRQKGYLSKLIPFGRFGKSKDVSKDDHLFKQADYMYQTRFLTF